MKPLPRTGARVKGQPLMALVAVPLAWAALRFATMDATLPGDLAPASALAHASGLAAVRASAVPMVHEDISPRRSSLSVERSVRRASAIVVSRNTSGQHRTRPPLPSLIQSPRDGTRNAGPVEQPRPASAFPTSTARLRSKTEDRWQVETWLVLREGSERARSPEIALPLYGGSQTGAVLRYRLAVGSRLQPAAYLRAVHALGSAQETDLAVGFAARPLPSLPLTAHAEARIARRGGSTELRPAAFLTTGIDDAPLRFGARVRGYAQMGYVGGREPTAFADGSVVADRQIMHRGDDALSIGAGSWAGAQRGATRLDLGPTASVRFKLADGFGRLAVDYRFRVAGNAEPASGAALTLSAGF